ncbi:MAG: DUF917 domain-containing protein, partial [Trueperaceae bacterium]|nr:DUF917 domain-containing protein [Trueperaceae bacterium]
MRIIQAEDLEDVAVGAAVLGTGGGGDPYIGKLMAKQAIRAHGPVRLIDVDELDDDALVVPAAMMGAPTVMVEKIPRGDELTTAFRNLEAYLGRPITAVLCGEAGGMNSTTPFVVAAETGLPLVDGDGMGRAFPELQMVSFTLHGVAATPMVMADDKGNSVVMNTVDNRWTERIARAATIEMGGSALIAFYAMDGATAKRAVLRGTVSKAQDIGRALRTAHAEKRDGVEAIRAHLEAFPLFSGKIVDVVRRTEGGFARGEAVIEGVDADAGRTCRIAFQNEFLVARTEDAVLATTPDLITILDADSGEPITTESLRFGFRVTVLGIPCDPQ